MPENPAFIKTIVTTNMGREVAERNGVHVDETFTGFKFMAEKLAEYKRDGSYNYMLAYEESYGYMMGDYVRDKDAVTASMLIAEMAASYFKQGMTLADALEALYEKYGWFGELTLNLVMPGLDGLEKMRGIMASLRAEPPKEIGGAAVLGMRDYQSGTVSVAELGVVGKTPIVGSNVLYFRAGRRHGLHRPSQRHRAEDKGLYPRPGREPRRLRRAHRTLQDLCREPEQMSGLSF